MVRRGSAFWKNMGRTVRGTLSRFLAIFAIVGLGVGFLAGLLASPDDMRVSADKYCDETDLYDVRVVSTLGLTEDDLAAIGELPGVEAVTPAYDTDVVLVTDEGDPLATSIHSMPAEPVMNRVTLQEGRLPQAPGECVAVMSKSFNGEKSRVGETLRQEPDEDGNINEALPETFTIVGLVKSSAYFSIEQEYTTVGSGKIGLILYAGDESFDQDCFTAFYLTVAGAKELNAFSAAYEEKIDAVEDALEPFGETRSEIRFESLKSDAQAELDDARAEYEQQKQEAEDELAQALQELEDGEAELAESEQTLADAKQEIDDGEDELAQGRVDLENELAAARREIDAGYAQIADYQRQLDEGLRQIEAGQKQLDAGYAELAAGEKALAEAKAQLDQTKAQLDGLAAGKEQLFAAAAGMGFPEGETSDGAALSVIGQMEALAPEAAGTFAPLKAGLTALAEQGTDTETALTAWAAGQAEYEKNLAAARESRAALEGNQKELDGQWETLAAQQAELNTQKAALEESEAQLEQARIDGEAQLEEARQQLEDAKSQYAEGVAALEDGRKELADGRADYADARQEADQKLRDGQQELDDAQADIDAMEPGEWLVFTRENNTSFSSYDSNAEKIAAIATVFPLFFFLVAALVALTTMTRMVEEERGLIGTMKALGYSSVKISRKYLLYAAFASITGGVLGLLIGMRLFPFIIINAYNIMYDVPEILTPFHLSYALVALLAAVLCTLAATLSACAAVLKESPASLMLPKAPKPGKRIFLERIGPVWRRMKFTSKVTARNLLRYKKRFFMTVVGIAGCTALLVTGFGLRDSISDIVHLQFDELDGYQLIVGLQDQDALDDAELQDILADDSLLSGHLAVMQNNGQMAPREGYPTDEVTIFVPSDTAACGDFFHFRHRTDKADVAFDEQAVIVSEKLAERQNLTVGGQITLHNQDGAEATFTVTDICENYVYHYVFLPAGLYEEGFGAAPEWNSVLGVVAEDADRDDREGLATRLLACEDVAMAQYTTDVSESFQQSLKGIDSIVWVLILSAGALAFVVLYNLTNINISEREKELATIKVLGFFDGEVSAYIYRETAVLTLIGAGLGLVLGIFLHQFVIRTAEIDIVMFGRSIYGPSFLWSFLLTLVFSVLVNLVMHRKLKHISMVESLKAPE